MSPGDAYRALTAVWEGKHEALRQAVLSRQCAACKRLQVEALEVEVSALAYALDCLRNQAGGGR